MQSSDLFSIQYFLFLLFLVVQLELATQAVPSPSVLSKQDWAKKREDFHQSTSFNLSEKSMGLLPAGSSNRAHLPFWFDFELFKIVFNKNYANQEEEFARHDVFIKACVRVLRNRFKKQKDGHIRVDENDDKVS